MTGLTKHFMSADDLAEWRIRAKSEPAPEYEYNENGIAQQAINVREWKRRVEWYEEMNDEIVY